MSLRSERGSTLLVVMAIVAIMTIMSLTFIDFIVAKTTQAKNANVAYSRNTLELRLRRQIEFGPMLYRTIAHQTFDDSGNSYYTNQQFMRCVLDDNTALDSGQNCSVPGNNQTYPLWLYNDMGELVAGPNENAPAYYTLEGEPCFLQPAREQCAFRAMVKWVPVCPGHQSSCNQAREIKFTLTLKPTERYPKIGVREITKRVTIAQQYNPYSIARPAMQEPPPTPIPVPTPVPPRIVPGPGSDQANNNNNSSPTSGQRPDEESDEEPVEEPWDGGGEEVADDDNSGHGGGDEVADNDGGGGGNSEPEPEPVDEDVFVPAASSKGTSCKAGTVPSGGSCTSFSL